MRGVDTTTEEYLALLRTADECVQAARAGDDEALGAAVARADADGRVGELLGVLAMSAIGWLPRG